jgi:hypothetical protein
MTQMRFRKARAGVAGLVTLAGVMLLAFAPNSAVRAADTQSATAILDSAIKALGGEEKLGKIQGVSWKAKGTITFMGSENPMTTQTTLQGLDHARQEFSGEFGGSTIQGVTVLAGDKGWRSFGGNHEALDQAGITAEKQRNYLALVPVTVLPLKGKEFKVEAAPEETIGGKPAVGIKATGPDNKDFTLYFDKESGLPVRLTAKVTGFMGDEFTQESIFSDYQDMSGIKKATKITIKRDGEKFIDTQISEFKVLETVDAKTFAEPQG